MGKALRLKPKVNYTHTHKAKKRWKCTLSDERKRLKSHKRITQKKRRDMQAGKVPQATTPLASSNLRNIQTYEKLHHMNIKHSSAMEHQKQSKIQKAWPTHVPDRLTTHRNQRKGENADMDSKLHKQEFVQKKLKKKDMQAGEWVHLVENSVGAKGAFFDTAMSRGRGTLIITRNSPRSDFLRNNNLLLGRSSRHGFKETPTINRIQTIHNTSAIPPSQRRCGSSSIVVVHR